MPTSTLSRRTRNTASPEAYVAALGGWQHAYVAALRGAVLSAQR